LFLESLERERELARAHAREPDSHARGRSYLLHDESGAARAEPAFDSRGDTMSTLPRAPALDSRQRLQTHLFRTRIMGMFAVCMHRDGADAGSETQQPARAAVQS
jgi:hypothetical protein